jgi:hypothetical protein
MSIRTRSEYKDELVLDDALMQLQSRWDFKAAKIVSSVFSPPAVISVTVIFIGIAMNAWKWSLAYLISVILVPTIYVFWLLRTNRITNFHMYDRVERFKPMVLTTIMTIIAWTGFKLLSAPAEMTLFAFVGIFQVVLLLLINLFWKISIHATAISGLSVLHPPCSLGPYPHQEPYFQANPVRCNFRWFVYCIGIGDRVFPV